MFELVHDQFLVRLHLKLQTFLLQTFPVVFSHNLKTTTWDDPRLEVLRQQKLQLMQQQQQQQQQQQGVNEVSTYLFFLCVCVGDVIVST